MFNLLPYKEKKKVHKQYTMRKLVVVGVFLLLISMSASIFLLPSYILVSYKNQEIQAQIDNLKATAEKKNRPELTRRLADINSKINSVVIPESEYAHYDLIEKILSLKPAGVAIDSLAMNHVISKDKTDVLKVRMSGVSDTRNNLVTFNDALKADDTYVDVYLPIESLAQEFETDFVINFDINL